MPGITSEGIVEVTASSTALTKKGASAYPRKSTKISYKFCSPLPIATKVFIGKSYCQPPEGCG